MDIATVIGVVSGFALLFVSIILGGDIGVFVNVPSLLVVLGGSVCAILIAYPLSDVIKVMSVVKKAFTVKEKDPIQVIIELIKLSIIAKSQGPLKLLEQAKTMNDTFMARGIQMIADDLPREVIEGALSLELQSILFRHKLGQDIMADAGAYAPAFGMIGTLIGLVQMLATLDDPSTIGPKMAVALITTFYGAVVANLMCIPIKKKLKIRSENEKIYKQLCIVGLLGIQNRESPMILEDKMKSMLNQSQKTEVEKQKKSAK